MGSDRLPLVLVVDDEQGAPELLAGRPGMEGAQERALAERAEHCRHFGLLPEEGPPVEVEEPVARAIFVSGLRWTGAVTRLDREGIIAAIERLRQEYPPGPALVLLDLTFQYGPWDTTSGKFRLVSRTFGSDVLLPAIQERYGIDRTAPGGNWTALPVVVVSALSKEEMDEVVRRRGARGMLMKRKEGVTPEMCRSSLRAFLHGHGLLPDARGRLLGVSIPFLNVLAAARRAGKASSVLLLGESGAGKELLARYIHDHSSRNGSYRVFNASGRGDELQEDELFGHWAGAYTGAERDRPGLLEEASGGTLFIDEIGDVGLRVQNALMRPLQERVTTRIGRPRGGGPPVEVAIDLLFLFATNKDLHAMAAEGRFKPDLLERIEEVVVTLPPLRERREDIPLLAAALLERIDEELRRSDPAVQCHRLEESAVARLREMDFSSGNVRELRNLLLKAALANPAEELLRAADLAPEDILPNAEGSAPVAPIVESAISSARPSSTVVRTVAALERWLSCDPATLSVTEVAELERDLAGAAPVVIAALLEASYRLLATGYRGDVALPRLMEHFWGCGRLTSQQARRALQRLLQAEWTEGAVARAVRQSGALRADTRLAALIEGVLARWEKTHG